MFSSSIRLYLCCLLFVVVNDIAPINAAEMIRKEDGNTGYCNSSQDYERAKVGASRIFMPKVSLKDQKHILLKVGVDAAQCQKRSKNSYRWKRINPNADIKYEHSYYDLENGKLITRIVKIEHKKVWLAAIDNSYNFLGSSKITGTLETGFTANIPVDISKIFTRKQLSLIEEGQSVKRRIGLFVKAIKRHVSDEITTSYKEAAKGSMYYVTITMRRDKGIFYLL
jgi:hypothetical protein